LAVHFGQLPLPNEHLDDASKLFQGVRGVAGPGGLNYAEGGAKADSPYSIVSGDPEGVPISAVVQLKHFLAQHQSFAPDDLVTLFIGTNDAVYHYDPMIDPDLAARVRSGVPVPADVLNAERVRVEIAADAVANTATNMLAHGARRVLVFKLFDLGATPWVHTAASRAFATEMTQVFNHRLIERLPSDTKRLLVIDTAGFIDDLLRHAASYGFTHGANEDACQKEDQDFCFPETLKTPDADRTFIFAASEHLTTHANELLALYVLKQLASSALR
jgi:outer membrane lipase/esterase